MQSQPPQQTKPIGQVIEPEIPQDDSKALEEEKSLYNNKNRRTDGKQQHLHYVIIGLVWITFIAFAIVFLIRVLHYVLPVDYQWLTSEQTQSIDKLLFSGAIGGFIAKNMGKIIEA